MLETRYFEAAPTDPAETLEDTIQAVCIASYCTGAIEG
jgi:hypothetical protein